MNYKADLKWAEEIEMQNKMQAMEASIWSGLGSGLGFGLGFDWEFEAVGQSLTSNCGRRPLAGPGRLVISPC